MTKAQERKRLVRELDAVVREWVLGPGARCVVCGTTEHLQCGHLFSRTHYSTRWDARNVYAQCRSCNLKHQWDWWPMLRRAGWLWSDIVIERLHSQFCEPREFTNGELRTLLAAWRAKVGLATGREVV